MRGWASRETEITAEGERILGRGLIGFQLGVCVLHIRICTGENVVSLPKKHFMKYCRSLYRAS